VSKAFTCAFVVYNASTYTSLAFSYTATFLIFSAEVLPKYLSSIKKPIPVSNSSNDVIVKRASLVVGEDD